MGRDTCSDHGEKKKKRRGEQKKRTKPKKVIRRIVVYTFDESPILVDLVGHLHASLGDGGFRRPLCHRVRLRFQTVEIGKKNFSLSTFSFFSATSTGPREVCVDVRDADALYDGKRSSRRMEVGESRSRTHPARERTVYYNATSCYQWLSPVNSRFSRRERTTHVGYSTSDELMIDRCRRDMFFMFIPS